METIIAAEDTFILIESIRYLALPLPPGDKSTRLRLWKPSKDG
jgi:hypothetical protein